MVAVPVLARAGDVIGVVVLHTEAPREFDDGVLNFLVHIASLVGGRDRERAALRGDAPAGGGADHPDAAEPGDRGGRPCARTSTTPSRAVPASCSARMPARSGASNRDADELVLAGSDPPDAPDERASGRAALLLELMRGDRAGRGGAEPTRRACSWRRSPRATSGSACSVASRRPRRSARRTRSCCARSRTRPRSGLKKAELIERLTAENIVKDMFEALAAGSIEAAEAKAAEARCDLSRPHVFLHAERGPGSARTGRPGRSWRRAARRGCGASTRARSSTPATTACGRSPRSRRRLRGASSGCGRACDELAREEGLVVGLQRRRPRPASARRRMREAADAARIGALARGRGRRGLVRAARRLPLPRPPRARRRAARPIPAGGRAADRLRRRRGAQLVETLERYLADALQRRGERARPVHPPEHGAPAARANRAASRASTCARKTCCRSSWRSSSRASTSRRGRD